MKSYAAIILSFAISGESLAAAQPGLLVCPMKNHEGQNAMTWEFTPNESKETITFGKSELPATFRSATIEWTMSGTDAPPGGFQIMVNRYSGEITISFINPTTGSRLVTHSGTCSPASSATRKF